MVLSMANIHTSSIIWSHLFSYFLSTCVPYSIVISIAKIQMSSILWFHLSRYLLSSCLDHSIFIFIANIQMFSIHLFPLFRYVFLTAYLILSSLLWKMFRRVLFCFFFSKCSDISCLEISCFFHGTESSFFPKSQTE